MGENINELRKAYGDEFFDNMPCPWVGEIDSDELGLSFSPIKMKDIERFETDLVYCKSLCGIKEDPNNDVNFLKERVKTLEMENKHLKAREEIHDNVIDLLELEGRSLKEIIDLLQPKEIVVTHAQ